MKKKTKMFIKLSPTLSFDITFTELPRPPTVPLFLPFSLIQSFSLAFLRFFVQ